jgi:hypothetical protein
MHLGSSFTYPLVRVFPLCTMPLAPTLAFCPTHLPDGLPAFSLPLLQGFKVLLTCANLRHSLYNVNPDLKKCAVNSALPKNFTPAAGLRVMPRTPPCLAVFVACEGTAYSSPRRHKNNTPDTSFNVKQLLNPVAAATWEAVLYPVVWGSGVQVPGFIRRSLGKGGVSGSGVHPPKPWQRRGSLSFAEFRVLRVDSRSEFRGSLSFAEFRVLRVDSRSEFRVSGSRFRVQSFAFEVPHA